MNTDRTIDYYDNNSDQYFRDTVSIDMSVNCDRFLKFVRPGGNIIDLGAGSGRDIKYFMSRGYEVEGIDASPGMCHIASAYTGMEILCQRIQDWAPDKMYAGVWANASLLHLKQKEIEAFFTKLPKVMELDGVMYASFKSGIKTGEDAEGRYFTDVTEDWIYNLIEKDPKLKILESWTTKDQLARNDFEWINFLIKKLA